MRVTCHKLRQSQHAQCDAQPERHNANAGVVFQKERRDGQPAPLESMETMFRLPFLAIAVDGCAQTEARRQGVGNIQPPARQAVEAIERGAPPLCLEPPRMALERLSRTVGT